MRRIARTASVIARLAPSPVRGEGEESSAISCAGRAGTIARPDCRCVDFQPTSSGGLTRRPKLAPSHPSPKRERKRSDAKRKRDKKREIALGKRRWCTDKKPLTECRKSRLRCQAVRPDKSSSVCCSTERGCLMLTSGELSVSQSNEFGRSRRG